MFEGQAAGADGDREARVVCVKGIRVPASTTF